MVKRILASLILLFSVILLPFWLSVILALIFMAYFPIFLEGIFIFFITKFLILSIEEILSVFVSGAESRTVSTGFGIIFLLIVF